MFLLGRTLPSRRFAKGSRIRRFDERSSGPDRPHDGGRGRLREPSTCALAVREPRPACRPGQPLGLGLTHQVVNPVVRELPGQDLDVCVHRCPPRRSSGRRYPQARNTQSDPAHRRGVTPVTLHRREHGSKMRRVEAVLATIALVLIAGAFVGNLYASRRRAVPRCPCTPPVQSRLKDDRPVASPEGSGPAGPTGLYCHARGADRGQPRPTRTGTASGRPSPSGSIPTEYRPELRSDVEVKTFSLRWGNDYAMIANPTRSPALPARAGEVQLLPLMDGTRTVKEIVVERFQESGDMELSGVADLVRELRQGNFLTDRSSTSGRWSSGRPTPSRARERRPAEFAKTLSIDWTGAHRLVSGCTARASALLPSRGGGHHHRSSPRSGSSPSSRPSRVTGSSSRGRLAGDPVVRPAGDGLRS